MADVGHGQALAKKNSIAVKFIAGHMRHGGSVASLVFCGAWEEVPSDSTSTVGQALQVITVTHNYVYVALIIYSRVTSSSQIARLDCGCRAVRRSK